MQWFACRICTQTTESVGESGREGGREGDRRLTVGEELTFPLIYFQIYKKNKNKIYIVRIVDIFPCFRYISLSIDKRPLVLLC